MMRVRHALGAITIVAAILAPAAADAQRAPTPANGGTVVIAGPLDLHGLNPLVAAEAYTSEVIRNVLFLPLVRYDAQLRYEAALARSWRFVGDTAVEFRLRTDVFWHDGMRTTAHDVVFTWQRATDPRTAYPNSADLRHWLAAEASDSFTVRFRIAPHADPLAAWAALPIVPAHRLRSIAPEQLRTAPFNHAPIGNGPFRFVSHRAGDRWVFEANPRFPAALGGRPHLDRIVWRVIPENSAQLVEIMTGGVDIMLTPRAEQVRDLGMRPDLRGLTKPSRRYNFIAWNGQRAPLDDPRVRRALMHALDRQRMIDVLRRGFADLGVAPVAPYHWAFDASLQPLAYDPATAQRLLAEAGWRRQGDSGPLVDAGGRAFEIELKVAASSAANRDLAEMIRHDLDAIGVRVRVSPLEFATLIGDISAPERRFDAALLAFETDFRLNLRDAFHSSALAGPFQSASYSNRELDGLLDRVDAVTDVDDAKLLWSRIQRTLLDEQPWGVLWYPPELLLVRDRLQGFAPDIRGVLHGVNRWWLRRS